MSATSDYVLGRDLDAGRRLAIQDAQFAKPSEALLDRLALRPDDRVVEFGTGAGWFSKRVLKRLGQGGVLVAVDYTPDLLQQARANIAGCSPARFEPITADVSRLGPWLDNADVVVGRTMLHHVPMAEAFLGRLRVALRPGTRVGFIEPEFRALLGRFAALELRGRPELAVLRRWAEGISRFYQKSGLSPEIGATMGWALEAAGYRDVHAETCESPTDETVIENLLLIYDEVREKYRELGIMTPEEIEQEQRELRALSAANIPAVWGVHSVTAVV